ncbi:suppressor of fused domain protein [Amycolatopsis sp. NPDC049688]|uniref:suppressor of fused domain protein n=1 Tax=Amycolatopsis sp. NPDC049688 TaxID=3154733 RepID=UPI003444D446
MGLIEHLEARLGTITGGWKHDGYQVAEFDSDWFATIGLSRHPLHSRRSARHLRLELITGGRPAEFLPGLLAQVADEVLASGEALLRGDVVGPRGPLVPGSALEAWYAAIPVYQDDEFAAVDLPDNTRAAIVWLAPISAGEAVFCASHGWRAFEDELVRHDPDLLDLGRAELPLCRG